MLSVAGSASSSRHCAMRWGNLTVPVKESRRRENPLEGAWRVSLETAPVDAISQQKHPCFSP